MDDQPNPNAEFTHSTTFEPESASHASGMFSHSRNFTVTGKNLTNITNHYAASSLPSDFRMIPMGDIDLRRQIQVDERRASGTRTTRSNAPRPAQDTPDPPEKPPTTSPEPRKSPKDLVAALRAILSQAQTASKKLSQAAFRESFTLLSALDDSLDEKDALSSWTRSRPTCLPRSSPVSIAPTQPHPTRPLLPPLRAPVMDIESLRLHALSPR
ncbi:hypothetical protein C8R45DRAFT_1220397 [Mycena sanguinolenta]|nr:hypothetical protein C8R45DRAFT_1220397 [Mycena sanguinolenta]